MKGDPWVESDQRKTINGEKWVSIGVDKDSCFGGKAPPCEFYVDGKCQKPRDKHVFCETVWLIIKRRWYRINSVALAKFDSVDLQMELPEAEGYTDEKGWESVRDLLWLEPPKYFDKVRVDFCENEPSEE